MLGTCDWMNSVAELGLTPAASQSTAMLMTFCEISPELVVGGQRMPVDDAEKHSVLVLQPDPVLQYAVVVAKVQSAAGAHTGNHTPL